MDLVTYHARLKTLKAATAIHRENGPLHADHDRTFRFLSKQHRALQTANRRLRQRHGDAVQPVPNFHAQHHAMLVHHLDALASNLAGRLEHTSNHEQAAASIIAAEVSLDRAHAGMKSPGTAMGSIRAAVGAAPEHQKHLEEAADHFRLAQMETTKGDRTLNQEGRAPLSAASAAAIPRQNGRWFSFAAQRGPRGTPETFAQFRQARAARPMSAVIGHAISRNVSFEHLPLSPALVPSTKPTLPTKPRLGCWTQILIFVGLQLFLWGIGANGFAQFGLILVLLAIRERFFSD